MHFIVLFNMFSGLTPTLIIHENLVFHKSNEIVLITSKWLSTILNDLKPYEHILNKLSKDLGKARITAHSNGQL